MLAQQTKYTAFKVRIKWLDKLETSTLSRKHINSQLLLNPRYSKYKPHRLNINQYPICRITAAEV